MKITHFGHACVLVEIDGARLLFDPGTLSTGLDDIDGIDAVFISHEHDDHCDPALVARVLSRNPDARLYAEPGVAESLASIGAIAARPGDRIDAAGVVVEALGGIHAPVFEQFPGSGNVAYLVADGAFFHPGDSFEVPGAAVDVLALPTSGPWIKVADAIAYAREIAPRTVVPIHEGALSSTQTVFAMIAAFVPEGTTFVPAARGVPLEL